MILLSHVTEVPLSWWIGMVWRIQDSFTHMSGTLVGMTGRLSSDEIIEQGAYMGTLQHGSLRVDGISYMAA